jgi:hypothetical protein
MMPAVNSMRARPFRNANVGRPLASHLRQRQGMLFALVHSQADPSVPTFRYQKSLPSLPLPPLRQTLDKYLRSLEPFFLARQQAGTQLAADARTQREAWARSFESGIGARCQERLQGHRQKLINVERALTLILELAKMSPYNWLDDNFWLRKAYLESRSSLLINSNWWLALQDDLAIPDSTRLSSKPHEFNIWQLRRAAWVIKRLLEFKSRLDACVAFYT